MGGNALKHLAVQRISAKEYYLLRDERKDHVLASIELHQNAPEVFDFLGYDYAKWQQGFQNLEDIFEFVVSSKWFSSEIFLLKNRKKQKILNKIKKRRGDDNLVLMIHIIHNQYIIIHNTLCK